MIPLEVKEATSVTRLKHLSSSILPGSSIKKMSPSYGYLNSSKIFFIRFSLELYPVVHLLTAKLHPQQRISFSNHVICQESSRLQHLAPAHSFSSLPQLDNLLSLIPSCMHWQSKYSNKKCLEKPQNQTINIRNDKLH